jgi:hypothetical protein
MNRGGVASRAARAARFASLSACQHCASTALFMHHYGIHQQSCGHYLSAGASAAHIFFARAGHRGSFGSMASLVDLAAALSLHCCPAGDMARRRGSRSALTIISAAWATRHRANAHH